MNPTPLATATEFNNHINAANLRALVSLMSEDHEFIDAEGVVVSGKPACLAAWRGFFRSFPGYRNTFDTFLERGPTIVFTGRSDCPGHPELTGPALWFAKISGDRLTTWQVYVDNLANRQTLGIQAQMPMGGMAFEG
jgi:ketosteroid isomerase-like protein